LYVLLQGVYAGEMPPQRTRYNVFLDDAQLDGLRQVKERDGVLPAEQIRRAIDRWLEEKGIKRKPERTRPARRSRS
jgi:hypothetical protein